MVQVNHFRHWVKPRDKSSRGSESVVVNSFVGAVDPDFDQLAETEEVIVERLRDRGQF